MKHFQYTLAERYHFYRYCSKEVIEEISEGLYSTDIEVEVNEKLIHGGYDLILSVGQVVPHEVVGMANYSKNLFVGVGGRQMINKSHMLSAICGMEKSSRCCRFTGTKSI